MAAAIRITRSVLPIFVFTVVSCLRLTEWCCGSFHLKPVIRLRPGHRRPAGRRNESSSCKRIRLRLGATSPSRSKSLGNRLITSRERPGSATIALLSGPHLFRAYRLTVSVQQVISQTLCSATQRLKVGAGMIITSTSVSVVVQAGKWSRLRIQHAVRKRLPPLFEAIPRLFTSKPPASIDPNHACQHQCRLLQAWPSRQMTCPAGSRTRLASWWKRSPATLIAAASCGNRVSVSVHRPQFLCADRTQARLQ